MKINIIPTMKLCLLVEDVIMEATPIEEAEPQKDEEDGTQGGVSTTKIKMMGIITPMGIIIIPLGALGTIIVVIDMGIEGGSAFFLHLNNLVNKSMLFMKSTNLMRIMVKSRTNHLTCWIVRTTTPHKVLTICHRDSTNGLYKLEITTPQTAHQQVPISHLFLVK
jgi:hypothetical protein